MCFDFRCLFPSIKYRLLTPLYVNTVISANELPRLKSNIFCKGAVRIENYLMLPSKLATLAELNMQPAKIATIVARFFAID